MSESKRASEQTLQDELKALTQKWRGSERWHCPACTQRNADADEIEALLAKQAAPEGAAQAIGPDGSGNATGANRAAPAEAEKRASQPRVSADQLRQASEQAFMNIPDPHTSSAHFNEMARLLNAARKQRRCQMSDNVTFEDLLEKWRVRPGYYDGYTDTEEMAAGYAKDECADELECLKKRVVELRDKLQSSADAYDQKHEETGDRFYSGGASVREEDANLLTALLGPVPEGKGKT